MVKLFVGNLSPQVTSEELKKLFEEHGKVSECEIIRNYGFVHLDDKEEADKAFNALNNYTLHGRQIHIEYSTSKLRKAPGMDTVCFRCGAHDHKTHDCPLHDDVKFNGGGGKRPAPHDDFRSAKQRPRDPYFGSRSVDGGGYCGIGGYGGRYSPNAPRSGSGMYGDYYGHSEPAAGAYEDPLIPRPADRLLSPLYEDYLNARERYYYYRDRLERELYAMRRAGAAPVAPAPPPPSARGGSGFGSLMSSSMAMSASSVPSAAAGHPALDSYGRPRSPTSLVRYPELYYAARSASGGNVNGAPVKYDYDHYGSTATSSGSGLSSSVSAGRSLYDPYP